MNSGADRLTRDQWGLGLAYVTAQRSTCLRRAVGCVLVNSDGHVLATGYNGVARGQPHCNEPGVRWEPRRMGTVKVFSGAFPRACPGATSPSGTNLDGCGAIHAEQNALLQCADVMAVVTCYVTCSPCLTCVKMLLNTGCHRIVFDTIYPAPEAENLWTEAGRSWSQVSMEVEK